MQSYSSWVPLKPTMAHTLSDFISDYCPKICRGDLLLTASVFFTSSWSDAFTSSFFALRHCLGAHNQPCVPSFKGQCFWNIVFTWWTILSEVKHKQEMWFEKHVLCRTLTFLWYREQLIKGRGRSSEMRGCLHNTHTPTSSPPKKKQACKTI